MKIETVYGFLPVFIKEHDFNSTQNGECRGFIIWVNDLEDRIVIEHEKNHARENYAITLSSLFVMALGFIISPFITYGLAIFYMAGLWYMNIYPKGVYEKEVRAYKVSAKQYAKKYGISYDTACDHYARILLNSKLYGGYAKSLGLAKIKEDLLD